MKRKQLDSLKRLITLDPAQLTAIEKAENEKLRRILKITTTEKRK